MSAVSVARAPTSTTTRRDGTSTPEGGENDVRPRSEWSTARRRGRCGRRCLRVPARPRRARPKPSGCRRSRARGVLHLQTPGRRADIRRRWPRTISSSTASYPTSARGMCHARSHRSTVSTCRLTATGEVIPYDLLVVGTGARGEAALPGALTFHGVEYEPAVRALLDELERATRLVRRVRGARRESAGRSRSTSSRC